MKRKNSKEKMFYTASGLAIPKSAVVELDNNGLVMVWNWRKLKKWTKRKRK